jgi:signal peptidase II
MAFGWLSGNPLLLAFFSLMLLLYAFLTLRRYHLKSLALAGVGLILGGAMGNLFDRLALGYVIDLFDFVFVHFFVFNIADIMITAGAILTGTALLFRQQDWSRK